MNGSVVEGGHFRLWIDNGLKHKLHVYVYPPYYMYLCLLQQHVQATDT